METTTEFIYGPGGSRVGHFAVWQDFAACIAAWSEVIAYHRQAKHRKSGTLLFLIVGSIFVFRVVCVNPVLRSLLIPCILPCWAPGCLIQQHLPSGIHGHRNKYGYARNRQYILLNTTHLITRGSNELLRLWQALQYYRGAHYAHDAGLVLRPSCR